jgi:hypothetical protein
VIFQPEAQSRELDATDVNWPANVGGVEFTKDTDLSHPQSDSSDRSNA